MYMYSMNHLTSEGVDVSSIVRGDGVQVNTTATLSLPVVAVFT